MHDQQLQLATLTEFLSTPSRWCKGALARDKHGRPIPYRGDTPPWASSKAESWSILGAAYYLFGPREAPALLDHLGKMIGRSVELWNDSITTTAQDILELANRNKE